MNNQSNSKCPACSVPMGKVTTKSHYDAIVIIEQCGNCGGIWFNNMDFHKIKPGEANNVEILDKNKLQELSLIKNTNLYCPKDGVILTQFIDLNFPKEIIVEKCSKCDGFWFNRGEFLEFQNTREKNQKLIESKALSNSEFEHQIMKTLESSSNSKKNEILWNIANFLSTPINRASLQPFPDDPNAKNANRVINMVFGSIRLIMKLFLR